MPEVPRNLRAILPIVPLLVTLDQAVRALRVISLAEAQFPTSREVAQLRTNIKSRVVTDKDKVLHMSGVFHVTLPRGLAGDHQAQLRIARADVFCIGVIRSDGVVGGEQQRAHCKR